MSVEKTAALEHLTEPAHQAETAAHPFSVAVVVEMLPQMLKQEMPMVVAVVAARIQTIVGVLEPLESS